MFGELWKILIESAKDPAAGEIVRVIDALDECEQRARERFLDELINFYSEQEVHYDANIRLKFLVTSRPYHSIQSSLEQLSNTINYIHFDADNNYDSISKDINKVIDYRLPRLLGSKVDQDGKKQIAEHLKATEHRTYLWLSLILDVIKTKVASHGTKKKMRNLISELPSSVSAAYEQILSRSSDAGLAKAIFKIVLTARRPLTVSEMNVALEIVGNSACTSYKDLDLPSDNAFKSSIREICGLFVMVHDSQIYLIHQTAREFLLTDPQVGETNKILLSTRVRWEHTIDPVDAETLMAKVCISLLHFKEFLVFPKWGSDSERLPFWWKMMHHRELELFMLLEYASQYWVSHCEAIQTSIDQTLLKQASMLVDTEEAAFRTWYPIFCTSQDQRIVFDQDKFTILCELGLYVLLEKFLKESPSVDAGNASLSLGLLDASARGHEKVVQILLDAGANVNAAGKYGTALQRASACGREKVVQILLDAGANVNVKGGEFGDTALQRASASGHEKVVQILLDAGANVNAAGRYGTELQKASASGHEKVVQMLLDAGADVNAHGGRHNGTTLQRASALGHEKVVKVLLDAGADVNADGVWGTALERASVSGHEKIVQMLLDAGANVNADGGKYDGTALQKASALGHEKVVQMLLDAGADVGELDLDIRRRRLRRKRLRQGSI